jgi:hypothetical protein
MLISTLIKSINPFKNWRLQSFKQHDKVFLRRFLMKRYGANMLFAQYTDFAHDHPQAFWTWPLWGYSELVLHKNGEWVIEYVKPWKWQFKSLEHAHIFLGHGKPYRYDINNLFNKNMLALPAITICYRLTEVTKMYGAWVHKDVFETIVKNYDGKYGKIKERGDFKRVPIPLFNTLKKRNTTPPF